MRLKLKITAILLTAIASVSFAGEGITTTVNFNKPEKFTDFKTVINLSVKDRERLMQQLQELMSTSVANILTEGNSLEIMIDNIDLAGNFHYIDGNYVRIVENSDRIRLEFSYRLLDTDGKVIKQADVELTSRDSKLLNRFGRKYKASYFSYEMPLFDDWLSKLKADL
ncbi:MAG: DUF3016 domain-containing protein [Proteobacteria bacterium]|nr:DUF3016 domain-containing protein [Pseudomonadota bacterium]